MRGQRRTVASALAEALTRRPGAEVAALSAAFAEACGPRLAQEVSFRGCLRDGRLLVLARTGAWAREVVRLEREICDLVNRRLGRPAATGLDVRVAEAER
ncbi:MAG TPA: DciA family protein [Anaeromyxobacteraceae bacterium]|nr:DciA family protein [Anaeromyxobacteraceae bacterium]